VPRQAPLEHIVLAVDGSERPENVEALALRFGSLGHPSFRIVYTLPRARVPQLAHANAAEDEGSVGDERQVTDRAESYVCGIAARLRAAGLRAEILVSVMEDPARTLLDAAERDGAGALVLMGQRH
jgi:nucleotide-binding universal stress UspA family protein